MCDEKRVLLQDIQRAQYIVSRRDLANRYIAAHVAKNIWVSIVIYDERESCFPVAYIAYY